MDKGYSVLMSVYYKENPEWFRESIESMMNQTVRTNDFVIVKDGKLTNELDEVISEYCKKYPDIFNIVELEKNMGLGLALATGILKCKNELVARMDSDDYSVPDRCEKQLKEFEEDETLDIIGSNQAEFIENINNVISYKNFPNEDDEIKKYARRRNPFSHSVVMFKKSKVLQAGNYRKYYLCEDYDLWARMIENNAVCKNINETLNYVRISEDLYKRRGGIKYLKTIMKFKKEMYKKGFYTLNDYIISSGIHTIVCLMPNFMRKFFYEKMLRKRKQDYES